jgi:AraC-like DNA-binding protein
MLETVFRTDDLPAAERFGIWSDRMRHAFAPMNTFSEHADRFHARQRLVEFGDVQVWEVECGPSGMRRPGKLVRESDPELCSVYITQHGRMLAETAGRTEVCGPGDLYIQDTSHPSGVTLPVQPAVGAYRALAVMIPRAGLPLSAGRIDRVLGARVPKRDLVGDLLPTVLARLIDDEEGLTPADAPRLGVVLRDLVVALFARLLDAEECLPEEGRERVLALRLREFILHNLSDPDLDPARIAAAHHISVSYLHQAFRGQEHTVARWIRHQRLEHARRDLADPARRTVPVQQIAARWGFRSATDFTRAFRATYGTRPTQYRATFTTHR